MASIRGFTIENFRSVGPEGVAISFPKASPLVLLGENNAGKSNIVKAIELVLGESHPKGFDPEDHHFYERERDSTISIDVHFRKDDMYGGDFRLVNFRYNPDSDEDPVTYGGKPPRSARHDYSYLRNDDRESCTCIVVGPERDLEYELSYKSKYTFLSKLMKRFHKSLLDDEETKEDLESMFGDMKDRFHDVSEFSDFVDGLQYNLNDLVSSMSHQLEVDFEAYNPVNFFKALRLQAVEGDEVRTLDELGTGEEQVLAISFAHAYAKAFHSGVFLIIEEPEAHLHPVMQRWLSRRIHGMSSDGLQILMTTHSPAFVDLLNLKGLVLVKKGKNGTYAIQKSPADLAHHCIATGVPSDCTDPEGVLPFYKAHVTQEIKNGFFAKKVVLVEGLTEKLALPYYFREVGFDPLEEGIEIIGVGGKGNLAKWWRLFTLYEIPTFIIFDNDDDDDESGERRRDALGALNIEGDKIEAIVGTEDWLVGDKFSVFGVDFETALRGLFPSYTELETHAENELGTDSKPFVARYVAKELTYSEDHDGWNKFADLADAISAL